MSHTPVLLKETLSYLDLKPGKFIIDGTLDGGGHAREIISRIMPEGTFLGVEWDPDMLARTRETFPRGKRILFAEGNYAELLQILVRLALPKAHGLLLDLGFSSEQLAHSGRGFSFERDEPLIMTYNPRHTPVHEILRVINEQELANVIYELSGERYAKRIARAIKAEGRKNPIRTSKQLADLVRRTVPGNYETRRLNPATRTFQALRIHANDELGNLQKILESLPDVVCPGGRAVIISFHSLEDRLVKNYFRSYEREEKGRLITKKPISPTREEERENPRSRSAKLRVIEMI